MNLTEGASNLITSVKNFFSSSRLIYTTFFSIVLNLVLACSLVYLWHGASKPAPIASVVDNSEKVLAELKSNLEQLRVEHKKNIDEYNEQVKSVLQSYNARLTELEVKREQTTKKIVEQHIGDVDGLAKDFSTTMRIPLGAKK